eukprot:Colp12_sorted_trinity150504_noHs@23790
MKAFVKEERKMWTQAPRLVEAFQVNPPPGTRSFNNEYCAQTQSLHSELLTCDDAAIDFDTMSNDFVEEAFPQPRGGFALAAIGNKETSYQHAISSQHFHHPPPEFSDPSLFCLKPNSRLRVLLQRTAIRLSTELRNQGMQLNLEAMEKGKACANVSDENGSDLKLEESSLTVCSNDGSYEKQSSGNKRKASQQLLNPADEQDPIRKQRLAELRSRQKVRDSLEELGAAIPQLPNTKNPSKTVIIKAATSYIAQSREAKEAMTEESRILQHTKKMLERELASLRMALAAATTSVELVDPDLKYSFCDKAWEMSSGYSFQDMQGGFGPLDFAPRYNSGFSAYHGQASAAILHKVERKLQTWTGVLLFVRKDGKVCACEASVKPVTKDGKFEQFLCQRRWARVLSSEELRQLELWAFNRGPRISDDLLYKRAFNPHQLPWEDF